MGNGYYGEVRRFMSNLLSGGLKGNTNLYRGLMTGIVRMSGAGIFSGLNNVNMNTITAGRFGDKFGFLESEVKEMLKSYGIDEDLEGVREWYNGYRVLDERVYNPYSLLTFLQNGEIVNAWIEASDNKLAKRKIESFLLFEGSDGTGRNMMEKIVSGGEAEIEYKQDISIEASGIDEVLSLLLSAGYLTFEYVEGVSKKKDKRLKVRIPNEEVREVYMDTLDCRVLERYKSVEFETFLRNVEEGEEDKIRIGIESHLMDASFHDITEEQAKRGEKKELMEKDYHNFLHGIFRGYIGRYEVKSNREAGKGRYDLMMIPKKNNKHKRGMIIEFKAENKKEREERERRKKGQAVKSDEEGANGEGLS